MKWALAIIVLFAASPLVSLILAILIAAPFGCRLDEGSVYPCVILGVDFGTLLYVMSVSAWFVMFTVPFAGLALIVWLVVLLSVLFVRRARLLRQGG
jgi:hypothetical protein